MQTVSDWKEDYCKFISRFSSATVAEEAAQTDGAERQRVERDGANLELLGEVVGDDSGEGGEERSEEDADVADVDGDVEKV